MHCHSFLCQLLFTFSIFFNSPPYNLVHPPPLSGCAAPTDGLTLNCQLARDPSSGCIAIMMTSLPGSK